MFWQPKTLAPKKSEIALSLKNPLKKKTKFQWIIVAQYLNRLNFKSQIGRLSQKEHTTLRLEQVLEREQTHIESLRRSQLLYQISLSSMKRRRVFNYLCEDRDVFLCRSQAFFGHNINSWVNRILKNVQFQFKTDNLFSSGIHLFTSIFRLSPQQDGPYDW